MNITPTNFSIYNQTYFDVNFKGKMQVAEPKVGFLKSSVERKISIIANAYREIMHKLESKSPEGIGFILNNYPHIDINSSLIFKNCGENKTSILIKIPESRRYKDFTRIIVRKYSSQIGRELFDKSFLIKSGDKLVKCDKPNNQNVYPENLEYYSPEEIEKQNLQLDLEKILDELDSEMFKFRIFLKKYDNEFLKTPDGKLSDNIQTQILQLQELIRETDSLLENLPINTAKKLKNEFESYKPLTGSSNHFFEHKEENIITNFHSIDSLQYQDLKRLSVYDSNRNLFKTFVVNDSGKMLKKVNQKFETNLPPKLTYADEKEILEADFQPSFQKYLTMHFNKVLEFNKFIKEYINESSKQIEPKELPDDNQSFIKNILTTLEIIENKLKKQNPNFVAEIKKNAQNLYAPPGRRGLTFEGFQGDSKVYILPLKNKTYPNLIRLTITDKEGNDKVFLVKDNKYIVKNYNPKFPQIVPPTLVYANEFDEIEDLSEVLRFLEEKTLAYKEYVETSIQNKPETKKNSCRKKTKKDEEIELPVNWNIKQVELLKFCKTKISEMNNNIKNPVDSFNKVVMELQEKLSEYLESRK